jgi:hypothetical protein
MRNTSFGWLLSLLGLCACGDDPIGAVRPENASTPTLMSSPAAGSTAGSSVSSTAGVGAGGGNAAVGGNAAAPAGSGSTSPSAMAGSSARAGAGGTSQSMAGSTGPAPTTEHFSFFVTSYVAMQRLAKSPNGFGGDLRYGQADGLAGADKICTEIAETSMPGAGAKGWRAFLSVTKGPNAEPVHAIDRVGSGPWYDRLGRLVAMTRSDLLNARPKGADPAIINDLPNEDGVPNHAPSGTMQEDNHDFLTGTNNMGQLFNADWKFTCHDWTSTVGTDGTPRVGHTWPRGGGSSGPGGRPGAAAPIAGSGGFVGGMGGIDTVNWMSALTEAGCAAGASLVEMGPPNPSNPTVGSGGGYGGIYCFALTP